MAKLDIEQILVLQDNYIYLLHDPETGATAVVDPSVSEPVLERLAAKGWRLTHILNTHHHADHTDGNLALKAATGAQIIGARHDAQRLPGLDVGVGDGDVVRVGNATARVMAMPGHTLGHLAYWFADSQAVFCGDTMFALGCGRLFEGSPAQMWQSLLALRGLPDDTLVYCAHEYTQANARFARTVEPANPALTDRIAAIETARARHQPTVPSLLSLERATNPFLRADTAAVKSAIGVSPDTDPALVFAEIRRRKDVF
jgi:hydroxyacylglutathione hydrolase